MVLRDETLHPHRQLGIPPTTALSGLLCAAHNFAAGILCKLSQDQKGLWWSFSCPAPPPLGCSAFGGIGKALGTMLSTQAVCASMHGHTGEGVRGEILSQMLPENFSFLCHCILLQLKKICFCTVGWKLLGILALTVTGRRSFFSLPLQHCKLTYRTYRYKKTSTNQVKEMIQNN